MNSLTADVDRSETNYRGESEGDQDGALMNLESGGWWPHAAVLAETFSTRRSRRDVLDLSGGTAAPPAETPGLLLGSL